MAIAIAGSEVTKSRWAERRVRGAARRRRCRHRNSSAVGDRFSPILVTLVRVFAPFRRSTSSVCEQRRPADEAFGQTTCFRVNASRWRILHFRFLFGVPYGEAHFVRGRAPPASRLLLNPTRLKDTADAAGRRSHQKSTLRRVSWWVARNFNGCIFVFVAELIGLIAAPHLSSPSLTPLAPLGGGYQSTSTSPPPRRLSSSASLPRGNLQALALRPPEAFRGR